MKIMSILKKGIVLGLASLTFVSVEGMAPDNIEELMEKRQVTLLNGENVDLVDPTNHPGPLPQPFEAYREELCNSHRGLVANFEEMRRNLPQEQVDSEIVEAQRQYIELYNRVFAYSLPGTILSMVLREKFPEALGKLNNLYRKKMGGNTEADAERPAEDNHQ